MENIQKTEKKIPENFSRNLDIYNVLSILRKKNIMGEIIIDKFKYITVVHSAGYYTDDNGVIYPFSVEHTMEEDSEPSVDIIWDDDSPDDIDIVEKDITEFIIEN